MGLKEIKTNGGVAVVQDPEEALFPDMPRNALTVANPDYCVKVAEMGLLLPKLIDRPAREEFMKPRFRDRGMQPGTQRSSGRCSRKCDAGTRLFFYLASFAA